MFLRQENWWVIATQFCEYTGSKMSVASPPKCVQFCAEEETLRRLFLHLMGKCVFVSSSALHSTIANPLELR